MDINLIYSHIREENFRAAQEDGVLDQYGEFDIDDKFYPQICVNGGVSLDDIKCGEAGFGFGFCDDYRQFLLRFGSITTPPSDLYDGMVPKKYRPTGEEPCDGLIKTTADFFNDFYRGEEIHSTTLFYNDQDEWFVLIDHVAGVVIPYDPFSHELVFKQKALLENFLIESL